MNCSALYLSGHGRNPGSKHASPGIPAQIREPPTALLPAASGPADAAFLLSDKRASLLIARTHLRLKSRPRERSMMALSSRELAGSAAHFIGRRRDETPSMRRIAGCPAASRLTRWCMSVSGPPLASTMAGPSSRIAMSQPMMWRSANAAWARSASARVSAHSGRMRPRWRRRCRDDASSSRGAGAGPNRWRRRGVPVATSIGAAMPPAWKLSTRRLSPTAMRNRAQTASWPPLSVRMVTMRAVHKGAVAEVARGAAWLRTRGCTSSVRALRQLRADAASSACGDSGAPSCSR